MSVPVQNLEEAANIASEFISSLDNLPSEVNHLLQEIKHKEVRSQELQQELARDQSRYIRHSLRTASPPASTPSGATPSSAGQTPTPTPTPTSTSGFKPHIPAKVATSYAELDQLADEKIALAQKVIELLAKTRTRLDCDLAKVRVLQGEAGAGELAKSHVYSGASTPLAASGDSFVSGRNPASAIGDNLRTALLSTEVLSLSPVASASSPPAHKKRRLTVTNSIKLPSPAPQSSALSSTAHSRSRLSRQIHPPRPAEEDLPEPENDPDAEGDEDFEADDAEDSTLYCFCQKPSSGEVRFPRSMTFWGSRISTILHAASRVRPPLEPFVAVRSFGDYSGFLEP
ncbi:hypothetical protein HGRIS_010118 [Hohenbuehelia grisea]|uniref:Inhibitor of growth protein N-terminal histone-binding domain-containing protein n=1 Tax=Hohenbuehelia grisea TaxID=104357 RepID=A0ABR3J3C0_9AGAR